MKKQHGLRGSYADSAAHRKAKSLCKLYFEKILERKLREREPRACVGKYIFKKPREITTSGNSIVKILFVELPNAGVRAQARLMPVSPFLRLSNLAFPLFSPGCVRKDCEAALFSLDP